MVVCTGNVCRSPYIERLLRAQLGETLISISSAGTSARLGSDMDTRVAQRLASLGVDAAGFSARQLTEEMAVGADLILCATRQHRSEVARMTPRALRRTFALADFSDLAAHMAGSIIPMHSDTETFVHRVGLAAGPMRSRVQPRTSEEAEIIDPFRQSKRIFEHMFAQVDRLLPPIVGVLTGSASAPVSAAKPE